MKKSLLILSFLLFSMMFTQPAMAIDPVYSDFTGKAIKGYDPVAYFTEGKAVKGDSDYSFRWNGAKWNFSSQQNLEMFKENPQKYAPQYGGYCAYAVSQGHTAKIDPDAWTIHEDKLYLNYNKNVQKTWEKDIPKYLEQGDKNWPKLLSPE